MEIIKPDQNAVGAPESPKTPVTVYLGSLSKNSRRTMSQALRFIAEQLGGKIDSLPWWEVNYRTASNLRAQLQDTTSPSNANRILSALRGVLRECWRLGLMDAERYHRARDIKNVKGQSLQKGRALDSGEIQSLVNSSMDGSVLGARDAALLGVAYSGGLRRSELVALNLEDLDRESGAVNIINAKGRKSRRVFLKNGGLTAALDWIAIRGEAPGALFYRVRKGGHVVASRLTDGAVARILERRAEAAKVDRFAPHDVRRTFISDLMDSGADISSIQKLAGHSSPSTTSQYDRRPEAAREKASAMLHFPYSRRA